MRMNDDGDTRLATRFLKTACGLALATLTVVGGTGCARKPPPPMQAPPVDVQALHYSGTALTGPRPAAGAVVATPAMRVNVEWIALEKMPGDLRGFVPLGAEARLVLATRDRQPVLPTSRLTAEGRWASGEAADAFADSLHDGRFGQTAPIFTTASAILPGTALSLRSARPDPSGGTSTSYSELILQHLPAAGAGAAAAPGKAAPLGLLEPALALQDMAPVVAADQPPPMNEPVDPKASKTKKRAKKTAAPAPVPPGTPMVLSRELVVLKPLNVGPEPVTSALVLPLNRPDTTAKAMALVIRAEPAADDPETQKLIADAIAEVRRQGDSAAGKATVAAAVPAEWPGYESALAALDVADARQRAMVYLASQTGARLCEDVALAADGPTLQQLAADIRASAAAAKPPFSSESLGWMLDRACLDWAARLAGENRLPPEMAGVLSIYAGEAGRRPASLEEMLRGGTSRPAFEARLVSENLIYLDDSSPAARVRALDWLTARGRAPAGYDPLAPPRQRREALERAMEQAAAAATQPTTGATTQPAAF